MSVGALGGTGLGGTYHDKNGLSGTVKYLGQGPKIIVSINVPLNVSVLPTSGAFWRIFTISPSSQLSRWQTIETYAQL